MVIAETQSVDFFKNNHENLHNQFTEGSANETSALSEGFAVSIIDEIVLSDKIYSESGDIYINEVSCPDALLVKETDIFVVSIARLYCPRKITRRQVRSIIDKKIRNMPRHIEVINWNEFAEIQFYISSITLLAPSLEIANYALEYIVSLNSPIWFNIIVSSDMIIYDNRPNAHVCSLE